MLTRNRWGCFAVVLVAALSISLILNFVLLFFRGGDLAPGEPPKLSEEIVVAGTKKGFPAEEKIAHDHSSLLSEIAPDPVPPRLVTFGIA